MINVIKEEETKNEKLPTFIINEELPFKFETHVLQIQNEYLKLRANMKAPLSSIFDRLITLEGLSLNLLLNNKLGHNPKLYSWGAINLLEIYLLFQQPSIIEIYCNNLNSQIIVNHKNQGKMVTNLLFSNDLWESIKIQSELNSNQILSRTNPTLKTGLITPIGNLRVSIQIPPLSNSPTLVIRRLPKTPINHKKLVEENQVSNKIMKYLIEAILSRRNIIISGEPSSGKTTLANALLLQIPPFWRLIVLEDASEVILPIDLLPLVVKFSIPSIGRNSIIKRETEISKLLHRSPDYVFLGEIQNKSDTLTMFEAFSAGIAGIGTTHSSNFDGLMMRWHKNYQIPESLINNIDIIVITKKILKYNELIFGIDSVHVNGEEGFREL
ncbi:MAG: Type IV secretion system protein PtlH [Candidatus Heimdallarchaeota archaeon LC_2]|nr:MAG: Type IV secretion system protein PtlH [Candidatus Heimdallarchaeota archaeon LC_2]